MIPQVTLLREICYDAFLKVSLEIRDTRPKSNPRDNISTPASKVILESLKKQQRGPPTLLSQGYMK